MRNFLLFSFLCFSALLRAQDTLYFTNSEKKVVVLMEINPDNVKYRRFDNQKGPVYSASKNEVAQVVFSNGVKEVFSKPEVKPQTDAKPQADAKPQSDPAPQNTQASGAGGSIPDTLFFKSGKTSLVWIKIVTGSEVKYKLWNYEDGPDYTASKTELKSVHYANGRIETFDKPSPEYSGNTGTGGGGTGGGGSEYSASGSTINYYQKGQNDAVRYYRHNGGSIGVGVTSALCSPLCGLIPAIPVALNEPSLNHLDIPRTNYSSNSDYLAGYTSQAHKMKKRKVWTAYGIGSGLFVGAVILSALLQQ
jgi:hypothetical protein